MSQDYFTPKDMIWQAAVWHNTFKPVHTMITTPIHRGDLHKQQTETIHLRPFHYIWRALLSKRVLYTGVSLWNYTFSSFQPAVDRDTRFLIWSSLFFLTLPQSFLLLSPYDVSMMQWKSSPILF